MPSAKNTLGRFQKTIFISIVIVIRLIPRVQTDLSFRHLGSFYFSYLFSNFSSSLSLFSSNSVSEAFILLSSFYFLLNFFHPLVCIRDRVLKILNIFLHFKFAAVARWTLGNVRKLKMNVIYLNVMTWNLERGM